MNGIVDWLVLSLVVSTSPAEITCPVALTVAEFTNSGVVYSEKQYRGIA
jgi:hypothetical protein